MAKTNRVCYCCGHEYYFCPSCPKDKKDPQIYTMWDSELCKDIFNTLVSESTKKITTKECKDKLIELGVNDIEIKKDSIKKHIDRVMSYEDIAEMAVEAIEEVSLEVEDTKEVVEEIVVIEKTEVTEVEDNIEEDIIEDSTIEEKTKETDVVTVRTKNRKKRNSVKNFDN